MKKKEVGNRHYKTMSWSGPFRLRITDQTMACSWASRNGKKLFLRVLTVREKQTSRKRRRGPNTEKTKRAAFPKGKNLSNTKGVDNEIPRKGVAEEEPRKVLKRKEAKKSIVVTARGKRRRPLLL